MRSPEQWIGGSQEIGRPIDWIPIALKGWAGLTWKPIILVLPLLLGGCADWAARWIVDSAALYESGRAYVVEIHDQRRFIRAACRASLVREIDKMIKADDESALREMLARNYPDLVTVDIIKKARADQGGVLAHAPGCG